MEGTLSLFGFPSTVAHLDVLPRSTGWRALRAAFFIGGALVLVPVVGLVPPHAPWVVGVLGIGGFLGIRKWRERFTILSFQGACPRCGGALSLPGRAPLRPVMTISCEGCNHVSSLATALPDSAPVGREAS